MRLSDFVEFQQFGWVTVSFIAIILLGIYATYGLYDQYREIRQRRSGRSLRTSFFIYLTLMLTSCFVYGLFGEVKCLTLVFNGLLRIPLNFLIVIQLAKHRSLGTWDKVVGTVYCAAIIGMLLSKSLLLPLFLFVNLSSLYFPMEQMWEMWREKNRGSVSKTNLGVYFWSTSFWSIYSVLSKNMGLLAPSFSNWALYSLMLLLWYRLPADDPEP